MRTLFKFPLSENDLKFLSQFQSSFCIVGVFSTFSDGRCAIPGLRKRDFIGGLLGQYNETPAESESPEGCWIELIVNEQSGIVVLDVKTPLEFNLATDSLTKILQNSKDLELVHTKLVMFLMHVCQFVILVQPSASLTTRLVASLRLLDTMRHSLTAQLMNFVARESRSRNQNPPADIWMRLGGRFCVPRFIMCCLCSGSFFESFNVIEESERELLSEQRDPKDRAQNAFVKFCSGLEEEVYHILRKGWIVHDHGSVNGLLAVPPKKPFIYLLQLKGSQKTASGFLLQRLARKISLDSGTIYVDGTDGLSQLWSDHIEWVLKSSRNETPLQQKHSFTDPIFDFPKLSQWVTFASTVYEFFLGDTTECKYFEEVKANMDVLSKFSDHRCAKALPSAFRVYQDNLPNQYTSEKHSIHVQKAVSYFSNYARGPSFERYLQELKEKCHHYWQNGHQVCEVQSLTNHHCVYGFHFTTDEEKQACANSKTGAVKPHNSKVRSNSACNCGRKVGNRDDSFTIVEANITFYREMDKKCCGSLERIFFPTAEFQSNINRAEFQNTSVEVKPSRSVKDFIFKSQTDEQVIDVRALEASQSQFTGTQDSKGSTYLTLDELSITDLAQPSENSATSLVATLNKDSDPNTVRALATKTNVRSSAKASKPQVDMLCSECEDLFLPETNMWSFVKFGQYSSYESFNGLDLPGFIHGTNFLLPFDAYLVQNMDELWPQLKTKPAEQFANVQTGKRKTHSGQQTCSGNVTVGNKTTRAYIGYEYECFKGTRFFLSSPDCLVKGSPAGPDVAMNAIASSMPLYYQCGCRMSKNRHYAQLMRIHFVTPPLTSLALNPVVRPLGEGSVAFFPQWDPIRVPADGYWVLRLPYIYSSSKGPIQPPRDAALASLACIEGNLVTGASFKSH